MGRAELAGTVLEGEGDGLAPVSWLGLGDGVRVPVGGGMKEGAAVGAEDGGR
jgi:hypothetical protein